MRELPITTLFILFLMAASSARAQAPAPPDPINTDRPGILFSIPTVKPHVLQVELGIPSVTIDNGGGTDFRATSLVALVRYGLTDKLELRLGSPVYTETRVTSGGSRFTDHGFGDVEVGAKWRVLDGAGARPSFVLIPSVIVPVGEKGFSAERPVYQLNTMAEWALTKDWSADALAGYLNSPSGGARYGQETFAVSLGRALPSSLPTPRWSAYGEVAYIVTHLDGASNSSFLGGGIKYLAGNDIQLDLSFDRGLSTDSPDWLFGLGLSTRF